MDRNLVSKASIVVNAPGSKTWDALVNPESIKRYFFNTNVVTDWREGSPIVWEGEWEGKAYEDKGVILQCKQEHTLQYTHFSPLSGLPDIPENYHTVTITLWGEGKQTRVSLTQDNNATEEARAHTQKNWEMVLDGLKKFVEGAY